MDNCPDFVFSIFSLIGSSKLHPKLCPQPKRNDDSRIKSSLLYLLPQWCNQQNPILSTASFCFSEILADLCLHWSPCFNYPNSQSDICQTSKVYSKRRSALPMLAKDNCFLKKSHYKSHGKHLCTMVQWQK